MINILIDRSGKTSKENIFLGNQHENLDETLHFSFPKEYDNFYKYITYSYTNNGCRITGISPLVDDNFIITSKITKCAGVWELNLICKISPVNLDDKVIDLTENNSTKEHIFISNTISACVSGNSIDVEAFNNVAVDENIASLYDSILALKNRVEENDKLHEQNEAIRKANELERQEAETTRKANESKRVSAEQLRVEAENARKADETKRQSNESARIEAETNRDTAESERVNAENQRAEAETARQSAETNRASAENKRASAEANRDNAENERVNAETSRKQAESARVSAETARTQAEANRVETEKVRVSAENAREQAEQSRVNAESQRVTAEATRESAERARVEAESAREQAEQSRVNAENLRVEAENKRDSVITKLREDLDANTKADGRTQRSLTALWDLNKGISYRFEEDTTKAYQKAVLTGAKLGAIESIGGRTIVYNQYSQIENGDGGWALKATNYKNLNKFSNHKLYVMQKYVVKEIVDNSRPNYIKQFIIFGDENVVVDSQQLTLSDITIGKTFLNKSIVQAPNNTREIFLYAFGDNSNGLTIKCNAWVNIIDLTQMFGSGNEPSTVAEFEAMFTEDYYPYNEGTLMSMGTKEVVNVGKNMFKCEHFSATGLGGTYRPSLNNSYGTSIDSIEPSNKVTVTQSKIADETDAVSYTNGYFCVSFSPIVLNDNYIVSFDITPTKKLIENAKVIILLNGVDNINASYTQDLQVGKTTRLYFNIVKRNSQLKYIEVRNSGISGIFENFQIEKGDTATAYTQYTEHTYTIPQAILNLEGYGWGVNNAYNYVDYENKKFIKNVGRVDLSTLQFAYTAYGDNNDLYGFRSPLPQGIKKDDNAFLKTNNLLCSKYPDTPWQDAYKGMDKTISQLSQSIQINDSAFTDAEAFKNSLNGVYLYYEFEAPIVTDISDIIDDTFQEPFEVEPNGSLTFKNVNGDGYRLAVPNNVQYTIKLNEVTS